MYEVLFRCQALFWVAGGHRDTVLPERLYLGIAGGYSTRMLEIDLRWFLKKENSISEGEWQEFIINARWPWCMKLVGQPHRREFQTSEPARLGLAAPLRSWVCDLCSHIELYKLYSQSQSRLLCACGQFIQPCDLGGTENPFIWWQR